MVFMVWFPIVYAMDIFWVAHSEIVIEFLNTIICIMRLGMLLLPRCVRWIAQHFECLESKKN
jgi:hypothetical protein